MRTYNKLLNSTPIDLSDDAVSPYAPLKNIILFAVSAIITGTPTGTIKLQASVDPETNDTQPASPGNPAPTNWVDIKDSDFTVTTAGETMWNVRDVGYNYVRVAYVDGSSGTSTATMIVRFNGKGI